VKCLASPFTHKVMSCTYNAVKVHPGAYSGENSTSKAHMSMKTSSKKHGFCTYIIMVATANFSLFSTSLSLDLTGFKPFDIAH